jgi:hypothetical protein
MAAITPLGRDYFRRKNSRLAVSGLLLSDLYQVNALEMHEQCHRQLNELASHYGESDIRLSSPFVWV